MSTIAWERIEPLLMQVAKPARYVGGEFNQVVRPDAHVRVCFAFPDLYEIGMSYHGYRLLYERINANPQWAAERAFTPWPDFQAAMREHAIPLYSLETRRPLNEFHWIGFTLQHEVNFTNILTMLDLAGIPLESSERTNPFPLLIGGGEGAFSPEPVSPFLDAFLVGDGEEACIEITAMCETAIAKGWDRHTLLRHLATLPGIYVPEFYHVDYNEDGTIAAIRVRADLPEGLPTPPTTIHKRYFDIAQDLGSVRPVVPLVRTVHDRLAIEIRRGCVNGCRFCQAGMITRPVNERSVEQILEIARQGIENTGYDEISLLSLSSADYTMIAPLVERFNRELGPRGISVSLPSLRINGFDVKLVDEIARVRKSGFTFAPEAGSTRLRQVINKPVDQEKFFEIIEDVFRRGWRTVKFYFMLGLPTETKEDLDGIVEICEHAARIGDRIHGRKATVNVTLSPFVPKSNTPFQWEPQLPREELERHYQYVRRAIFDRCGRRVDVKSADVNQAFIEACLARGDRRLARVVRRAWELGAQFDGWDELFRFDLWMQAFEDCGIDPTFYANRTRGEHEIFPYEHINSNIGRRFMWADQRRARMERWVEKCDTGKCAGCDVCNDVFEHTLAQDMVEAGAAKPAAPESIEPAAARPHFNSAMEQVMAERDTLLEEDAEELKIEEDRPFTVDDDCEGEPVATERERGPGQMPAAVQRLRLTYTRRGGLGFLSHLDFVKVVFVILRRAGLPLAYSQGFNPQPRVQFAPPMSLGMTGEAELVDVLLTEYRDGRTVLDDLNAVTLDGLCFIDVDELPVTGASLEGEILASSFVLEVGDAELAAMVPERIAAFNAAESWPAPIMKKGQSRSIDLRRSLSDVRVNTANGRARVHVTVTHEPGHFVKPHEALAALLDRPLMLGRDVRVARTGFRMAEKRILATDEQR